MDEIDEIIIIYLRLDPYLAQWLIHEHGDPVVFPKNSAENDVLELGLIRKPFLACTPGPGENRVPIVVPYFKNTDVRKYNYLDAAGRRSLAKCIRSRFVISH